APQSRTGLRLESRDRRGRPTLHRSAWGAAGQQRAGCRARGYCGGARLATLACLASCLLPGSRGAALDGKTTGLDAASGLRKVPRAEEGVMVTLPIIRRALGVAVFAFGLLPAVATGESCCQFVCGPQDGGGQTSMAI